MLKRLVCSGFLRLPRTIYARHVVRGIATLIASGTSSGALAQREPQASVG
jgi:hypothetical protein